MDDSKTLFCSLKFPTKRERISFKFIDNVGTRSQIRVDEENQLDSTQYFIELVIGSTYFGHHYAHLQEL
jgi:hypothetical protein